MHTPNIPKFASNLRIGPSSFNVLVTNLSRFVVGTDTEMDARTYKRTDTWTGKICCDKYKDGCTDVQTDRHISQENFAVGTDTRT